MLDQVSVESWRAGFERLFKNSAHLFGLQASRRVWANTITQVDHGRGLVSIVNIRSDGDGSSFVGPVMGTPFLPSLALHPSSQQVARALLLACAPSEVVVFGQDVVALSETNHENCVSCVASKKGLQMTIGVVNRID